ncbi:HU family DNA-binding protein [Marinobacterium sp. BA1]|uniref:HU family DNA-binding protein n=1 Tax=Marinobacterium sp. BA1 TaxID=3138931 RepID=UPI0034E8AEF9
MKNKSELVHGLQQRLQAADIQLPMSKVALIHDAVIDHLMATLIEDEVVTLGGYVKLDIRNRPARQGRNPQTGEPLEIAAHKAIGLKMLSKGKSLLND